MLIVKCTLVLEVNDHLTRIENNYNYGLMLCEEVMSSNRRWHLHGINEWRNESVLAKGWQSAVRSEDQSVISMDWVLTITYIITEEKQNSHEQFWNGSIAIVIPTLFISRCSFPWNVFITCLLHFCIKNLCWSLATGYISFGSALTDRLSPAVT